MPNNDNPHHTELPKLIDDGVNNNYREWKAKSYHKLCEWDLLKYIEGPESEPPYIPPLQQPAKYHGLNENDHIVTVRVLGNAAEHQLAVQNAKPWMTSNNITLSHIIATLPSIQLHSAQNAKYAKQAWENLHSVYQLQNSLHVATIKGHIMTYQCTPNMNTAIWLNDMQCLYNSLCDLEIEQMSDCKFALAILDLMPQDDNWWGFVSNL
jgi:hypothetical protein